jgi:hypothetical protein
METTRFRVLTPDHLVSYDTFVLADRQPANLDPDCVLLINESDGRPLVAHKTRLIAVKSSGDAPPAMRPRSVCLTCGKVEGVFEDEVVCPEHGGGPCHLVQPATVQWQHPAE